MTAVIALARRAGVMASGSMRCWRNSPSSSASTSAATSSGALVFPILVPRPAGRSHRPAGPACVRSVRPGRLEPGHPGRRRARTRASTARTGRPPTSVPLTRPAGLHADRRPMRRPRAGRPGRAGRRRGGRAGRGTTRPPGEVGVHRALRVARGIGDVVDRRGMEAQPAEHVRGRLEQPLPRLRPALCLSHPRPPIRIRQVGWRMGDAMVSAFARAGVGPIHLLATRGRKTGRLTYQARAARGAGLDWPARGGRMNT